MGTKAIQTLQSVHGTEYTIGNTAEILYAASGGSHDWAKGGAGIKFAYCYELRDTGKHGFVLPADQIVPSGEETFAAVQSMAEDVIEYYHLDETSSQPPAEEVTVTEAPAPGESASSDVPTYYKKPLGY